MGHIQQIRAVYEYDEWHFQSVCRTTIDPGPPGDGVAGVDREICNFAAVSFGGGSVLYPGGALKENEYYVMKEKANFDDSTSREATRLDRKRTACRTHFLHTPSKAIVGECAERGVGTLVVGDLGGIREDDENRLPTANRDLTTRSGFPRLKTREGINETVDRDDVGYHPH